MAAMSSKDKEERLQLKQQGAESKVFSKLFTRESSAAAPSFRVYYGVASAGSVPFLWESQPGTPKNDAVSTAALPPLTPPPSYYTARQQQQAAAAAARSHHHRRNRSSSSSSFSSSSSSAAAAGGNKKKLSAKHYTSIFSAILPKMILHRWSSRSSASSSPSASSCSSSSRSAFSSSASSFRSARSPAACSSMTMRSRVFAFSAADDDDGGEEDERAAAPMCFSVVRHESFRAFRGCRVAMTVKSALASVGGGGHGPGPAAAQKV